MEEHPLKASTVSLAGRAAEISTGLQSIREDCGHETTSNDISSIATELTLLSSTLWRLNEAMSADPEQYTNSFNDDLKEIIEELVLIFEEISECSSALQKADGGTSAVGWLFKKGRVHRLQKHLETLKTTLIVMRTVLWHGKDYGTHTSRGSPAQCSPHTMHEDRVILESVIAKNRNAILDLHNLEESRVHHHHSSSSSSGSPQVTRTPHRNLSGNAETGCSSAHDVLPPVTNKDRSQKATTLSRRFSRRSARLGVHMSMLNMEAQDAPKGLKDKWIRERNVFNKHTQRAGMSGGLGKITEPDSMASISTQTQDEILDLKDILDEKRILPAGDTPLAEQPLGVNPLEGDKDDKENSSLGNIKSSRTTTIGKGFRKMVRHLTISTPSVNKGKRREDAPANDENTLRRRLSVLVGGESPLRTPDFEKEFENGWP